MKLNGHKNMIIDVKIHEYFDYAYSFSIDGVNIFTFKIKKKSSIC